MKNIWQILKKPIMILAPMENVTDSVFRQIVARCGKPDLFFTEFTNTDGICSSSARTVLHRLQFIKKEKPIIAQIWGNNPLHYTKSATLISRLGFDGIDINMGCPDKSIVKKGSCAGLIKNQKLAKEIIFATRQGAGNLPVSVKTRIGYNSPEIEEWISFILDQNIDALTLHGRTVKEQSKVPAHWDEIKKAVAIRNKMAKSTLIIGNGDVMSLHEAKQKVKIYGVDGVMIGRGIFQNPWIFSNTKYSSISFKRKVQLLIEHIRLFDATWGKGKNFEILKKYYKIYICQEKNASEIRDTLMHFHTTDETIQFLHSLL